MISIFTSAVVAASGHSPDMPAIKLTPTTPIAEVRTVSSRQAPGILVAGEIYYGGYTIGPNGCSNCGGVTPNINVTPNYPTGPTGGYSTAPAYNGPATEGGHLSEDAQDIMTYVRNKYAEMGKSFDETQLTEVCKTPKGVETAPPACQAAKDNVRTIYNRLQGNSERIPATANYEKPTR